MKLTAENLCLSWYVSTGLNNRLTQVHKPYAKMADIFIFFICIHISLTKPVLDFNNQDYFTLNEASRANHSSMQEKEY